MTTPPPHETALPFPAIAGFLVREVGLPPWDDPAAQVHAMLAHLVHICEAWHVAPIGTLTIEVLEPVVVNGVSLADEPGARWELRQDIA